MYYEFSEFSKKLTTIIEGQIDNIVPILYITCGRLGNVLNLQL